MKQKYDFVGERSSSSKLKDAARITTVTMFFYCRATSSVIDHYAKDGGPGEACPSCSFYHYPLQQYLFYLVRIETHIYN